ARHDRADARPRFERTLAGIAAQVGEPAPEIDVLFATRGNSAILHTRPPSGCDEGAAGRWTLHFPLNPKNVPQTARHFRALGEVRRRFPGVPVPRPIWHGRADGALLSCEQRLAGWTAPQFTGDRRRSARMIADVSRHFAQLVVRAGQPFTEQDFEELIGT